MQVTAFMVVVFMIEPVKAKSNGNPYPGYPHDTINIHVQKSASGPKGCNGGRTLFLRTENGEIPDDTILNINTIDWNQVDNDVDGLFDEDPPNGVDDDGDGLIDEDGLEPGSVTKATDCDSYSDHEVSLQIRDTDPREGFVSTQYWSVRMKGKPGENIDFTTYANQTVSCTVIDPDGVPDNGDETVDCTSGDGDDWIRLASINLAEGGCVKQVKLGGKNPVNGGGKTNFCDITDGFLVDVDLNGDGVSVDQNIFSISCLDDLNTKDVDESLNCLSSLIWEIDTATTTSKAKLQIFVSHIGSASIKSGKITTTGDVDGNGMDGVVIDYGPGRGIWTFMNNSTWIKLHNLSPETVATGDLDNDGQDDVITDFGKHGIWTRMNNNGWVKLHTISPEIITTGDLDNDGQDDVITDFGKHGIWVWMNNSGWVKRHTLSPDSITTGDLDNDGQDDVITDFGKHGIWVWMNNSTWVQRHTLSPETITTGDLDNDGQDDVITDFGKHGIWVWMNNSRWVQRHTLSPETITTGDLDNDGQDDVITDFGKHGIWVLMNNNGWVQRHTLSPETITTGDMDGNGQDDVITDLGKHGIWILMNNSTWVKLLKILN